MTEESDKRMKRAVKRAVEKEVDEAEGAVKKAMKRQVRKEVEKEVDEEVGPEVKKEIVKALHHQFDIVDKFKNLEAHHKFLFAVIVGVGVISFWRGLWLLMDLFIFPGHPAISGLFTTLFGLTILAASGALLKVFSRV